MSCNSSTFNDELEVSSKYPKKILDTALCELWYSYEATVDYDNEPWSVLIYHFMSPRASGSIENTTMKNLLLRNVLHTIVEDLAARPDTMGLDFYVTADGIVIELNGRTEDFQGMIEIFVKNLVAAVDITEETFVKYVDGNKSFESSSIHQWLYGIREAFIPKHSEPLIERLRCLPTISLADFQQYVLDYFKDIRIQVLAQGNLDREQVIGGVDNIINRMGRSKNDEMSTIAVKTSHLPIGSHYLHCKVPMPRRAKSVVSNLYGIGPSSVHSLTMTDLLCTIAVEPFEDLCEIYSQGDMDRFHGNLFDSDFNEWTYDCLGNYAFTIVFSESDYTADFIDGLIEQFRRDLIELIAKMSDVKFAESKATTYSTPDTLKRSHMNWFEIISQQYDFGRFDAKVEYLAGITKSDFLSFLRVHFFQEQCKLSTRFVRDTKAPSDNCDIDKSYVESISEQFLSDLRTFKDGISKNQS